MKPSNVQTKSVVFVGVDIQPTAGDIEDTPAFDWNGVNIGIQTKHKQYEDNTYSLYLQFLVNNAEGKQAPYTVDIQVMGMFKYLGSDPADRAEDLVVVNGLSILYGTIREMVTMITSRMPHGAICLPGANFLDHRPSLGRGQAEEPKHAVPAKARASKKETLKASKTPSSNAK